MQVTSCTADQVQAFLDKFRKGFATYRQYSMCCAVKSGRNGAREIFQANDWDVLLSQFVDWHDEKEVKWLGKNGCIK